MNQINIQNLQDFKTPQNNKYHIINLNNNTNNNSNPIQNLNKSTRQSQGGGIQFKKNKKKQKQGQQHSQSQDQENHLETILNSMEDQKQSFHSDENEYILENSKIGNVYNSLVDASELHNNTVDNIRRKLSNQNVTYSTPYTTTNSKLTGKDVQNKSNSTSSESSSSNINQNTLFPPEDGFITVQNRFCQNKRDLFNQNLQLQQVQQKKNNSSNNNQLKQSTNKSANYTTNPMESRNLTNFQNIQGNDKNKQKQTKQPNIDSYHQKQLDDYKRQNFQTSLNNNNNNKNNSNSNNNNNNNNNNSNINNINSNSNNNYGDQVMHKKNSHSAFYHTEHSVQTFQFPKKQMVQEKSYYQDSNIGSNQLEKYGNQNVQNNNKSQISNKGRKSVDYVQEEQRQRKNQQNYQTMEISPVNHVDNKYLQSFDYYSNLSDSSHQVSNQPTKRKKNIKSKSIIEVLDQQSALQNEGSSTTPNDSKAKVENNFMSASVNCLEQVNEKGQDTNLTQSAVISTSCSSLPSPPPMALLREKTLSLDKSEEKEEGSLAIFRCPMALEKYNIKLWIVYIDNLIEVMFKLPIELMIIFGKFIILGKPFSRRDASMWVHFLLILIPVLIFTDNFYILEMKEYFDVSYWYHAFRGQSTLKLYGVLMTADVIDKMLCTFGEYLILDVLWQKLPNCSIFQLIKYLIPAILYVFLHSLVLFLSIIGYNVILNSDISFLFVLVFVHNSMKLKSSIFKKFTKDGYTSQTHADLRTRFSKCLYVFLIWASMRGFSEDIVRKLMYFLGSEVIVEWVKHIFLMLLNNLKLSIVESMSKSCKIFVAQVRIIPAFQTQEIMNNKALQTFMERENYLAQTPFVSPSLKVGLRVNFLAFHHAVIIIKIIYPLMVHYFSYHNFWIAIFCMRIFQIINDLLIFKFSFNNNEIIKIYTLKNKSLLRTIFQKYDYLIFAHGFISIYKLYLPEVVYSLTSFFLDIKNKMQ